MPWLVRPLLERMMTDINCSDDADVKRALLDLEKAREEVCRATSALEAAQKNLACAEAELEAARERYFKVAVLYNGLQKEIDVNADELVKVLLARAIAAFGSPPNPHLLSLYTPDGRELDDNKTLREAGVRPCEKLLLRPGAVKGGTS